MDYVLFVPGIMGTRLATPAGEEVWPPTPAETQFGYGRTDKLVRPDLKVGDLVRKVWCVGIYDPLIDQFKEIGFPEQPAGGKQLVLFPYDWRLDLEGTADLLAARLGQLAGSGANSIIVVAHSMGGLVARLALEATKNANAAWMPKVKALITLATPHLGAPLALARILGLDGALGISPADMRVIANDPRYPSAYQLLPAPGEAACWDLRTENLAAVDIYDPASAPALGLDPGLIQRVRFVHDVLGAGNAPKHIRYFFFAGTGHTTCTRINIATGSSVLTLTDDGGDGTVPLWSALPRSLQKQLVGGDHTGFFTKDAFKAVFYRLLGATFKKPPLEAAEKVELSVHSLVITTKEPVDLLLMPQGSSGTFEGSLQLERADDETRPFVSAGPPIPVHYDGPAVPQLNFKLRPITQPGQYRVRYSGQPGGSDWVFFAVGR